MINSKLNSNGLGDSRSGLPTYNKQPPIAIKKIPLRDVQNDNWSVLHNHTENSRVPEGGSFADAIKLSGIKRLTPDCPVSPTCHQFISSNGANDHIVNARRRFELELGKRRILDQTNKNADNLHLRQFCHNVQEINQQQTQMKDQNVYCAPAFAPIPLTSLMTFSFGEPSVPTPVGKPGNLLATVESNHLQVTSEVPCLIHSKETDDQHRKERFLHLQKFLKHCDEFDQKDYIQMLRNLSPTELSRHAFEVERRAIQLIVEEGKELQRMRELNILGKAVPKNNPSPTTQEVAAKK